MSDYNVIFDFHPNKEKIVVTHSYENYFNYIDLKGNILFEYEGEKINNPPSASNWDKYATYVDIHTNHEYVYLLYSGKKRGIYNKEKKKFDPQYAEYIHVFDWEGNRIAEFHLDRQLFLFASDDNYIYGVPKSFSEIVRYEIPDLN